MWSAYVSDGLTDAAIASQSRLQLTGDFSFVADGQSVEIPHSSERVLAALAMAARPMARNSLAGLLWLDSSPENASKRLRTALWRLRCACGELIIISTHERLRVAPVVVVDVTDLSKLATRLIHSPEPQDLARVPELIARTTVLADWDDEWVVPDRERYRLLRLEALERASAELIYQHRFGDALVAALAAAQSEPLRESARRLLIRVHLAHGNRAEAVRSYGEYRDLLWKELRVTPSDAMSRLVGPLGIR